MCHHFEKGAGGKNARAFGERGLGRILPRKNERPPRGTGRQRHGERSTHAAQFPGEGKLSGEFLAGKRLRRQLTTRGENPERYRQIESTRVFGQLCGREIYRDATRGKLEARVIERR